MKKQISIFLLTLFALLQSSALAQTVAPNSYIDNLGVHVVSNAAQSIYPTVPLINTIYLYGVSGNYLTDTTSTVSTIYVAAPQCTFQQTAGNYQLLTVPETPIVITGQTANIPEDVYVKDIAGTVTISFTAWTNATTPPTRGLDSFNRYTKNGDTTSLLVGAYNPLSATTTQNNTGAKLISNALVRRSQTVLAQDSTASWTTTSTTPVNANLSSVNGVGQVQVFTCIQAEPVAVRTFCSGLNNTTNDGYGISIALDGTSVTQSIVTASLIRTPAACSYCAAQLGLHTYARQNNASGGGTATFYGSTNGFMEGTCVN